MDRQAGAGARRQASLRRRPRCGRARGGRVRIKRVALVLRDNARPSLGLGGALLAPGSRRGYQAVMATAGDRGARGPQVPPPGQRRAGQLPHAGLPPARPDRGATRALPAPRGGPIRRRHRLGALSARAKPGSRLRGRLCADHGANRACGRRRVRVDNLCPRSSVGGGGDPPRPAAPPRRRGHCRGSSPRRGGTRSGRGARVCIATRVRRTGAPERIAVVPSTDADGRFRARIAQGPSREVRVAWWPSGGPALEHYLHLEVPRVPRLRLRPDRPIRQRRPACASSPAAGPRERRATGQGAGGTQDGTGSTFAAGSPGRGAPTGLATGSTPPPGGGPTVPGARAQAGRLSLRGRLLEGAARGGGGLNASVRPAQPAGSVRRLARMSASCSSIQTPGSRSWTISRRR